MKKAKSLARCRGALPTEALLREPWSALARADALIVFGLGPSGRHPGVHHLHERGREASEREVPASLGGALAQ